MEKDVERYQGGGAVEVDAMGERAARRNVASVVRTARRDCEDKAMASQFRTRRERVESSPWRALTDGDRSLLAALVNPP